MAYPRRLAVVIGAILVMGAVGQAARAVRKVLWRIDFRRERVADDPTKGWVTPMPDLMEIAPTDKGATVRDASGFSWFYGRMSRLVRIDPATPFLQFKVLAREGPNAVVAVRNASYKGKPFGVLWRPGIYTFPVYQCQPGWENKKEMVLQFQGFGSSAGVPPTPGPRLELAWMRLADRPDDRLEVTLTKDAPGKGAGALSPGDEVSFSAHLSAPAKDVYIDITRPIYNSIVLLTDDAYIQLHAADKSRRVWTARVTVSASAGPKRTFTAGLLDVRAVVVDGPVPALGTSNPWTLDLR